MFRFVLFLCCCCITPLLSQLPNESIRQLEKAFQAFDYETVISLSTDLMTSDTSLSNIDSLNIVEMQTVAYFSMGDMQGALNTALALLNLDPQFRFDPARTSPKIIRFVDDVRLQLLQQSQPAFQPQIAQVNIDSLNLISRSEGYERQSSQMLRNLILPGWGQWKRGDKIHGAVISTIFLALSGATVWSFLETSDRQKRYVNSTSLTAINQNYQSYNESYRLRNGLISGASILWLYSQISLLRSSSTTP